MEEIINYKIYCLKSNKTDAIYYGSTGALLNNRLKAHKNAYIRYKKGLNVSYNYSFLVLQHDDVHIELVEQSINTKEIMKIKEGSYIKNNMCVNKNIAGRTRKLYYKDNKDKLKEKYIINKQFKKEQHEQFINKYNELVKENYELKNKINLI